jgi:hypothetical protein
MYEMIYCSLASSTINEDDISSILKKAREFNSKNRITGCLLYHKREFIQILEGERKAVRDLYETISKDKRHFNVLLLAEGDKDQNSFDNWSMAFHELNTSEVKDLSSELSIDNFITFSDAAKQPTFGMKLFWDFAKELLAKN